MESLGDENKVILTFLTLILAQPYFYLTPSPKSIRSGNYRRVPTARLGKGGISDIQYSPDGRVFAVATAIGIWLYDTATSQAATLFTGDMGMSVSCMAFSPDGRTFAVEILQLWDTIIGEHQATLKGIRMGYIVFSSDGDYCNWQQ